MNLPDLLNAFLVETNEIKDCFLAPIPGLPHGISCPKVHEISVDACVIRLFSAWCNFCRELVLLSAYDDPLSSDGVIISAVYPSRISAITAIRAYQKKVTRRNFEPNWGVPSKCLKMAQILRVNNLKFISAAIGATPSPVENLKAFRDYYAHREDDTRNKMLIAAVNLGFPAISDPTVILKQTIPPGVMVFQQWIIDIQLFATYSISYR